jgi:Na+/proline symporter
MSSTGGRSYWLLFAWAAAALTVLVEPSFYNRVLAAKDSKAVRRALLLGILLWAAYDWGVVLIGMIAQVAVIQQLPGIVPDLEGRESLLNVCTVVLPTGLRGLMIGGILASAMSTIDSYSLLASGNIVYDMYRTIHRGVSDRALLLMTRIGVFVVIAASAFIDLAFSRMRDAWMFMTSVLVSIVLVPAMGALFAPPDRSPRPLAGLLGSLGGLLGLIIFYTIIFTRGVKDPFEESYVLRLGAVNGVGGAEIWQDSAVLFALPVSLLGYFIGHALGRPALPRPATQNPMP